MDLDICIDDLTDLRIAAFLEEHLADMRAVSPPESKHALDLAGLQRPEVTFWSVWSDSALVGCGAIKRLDASHAELKSMRTSARHRRSGIAARLLAHILAEARRRGFERLSLETGSMPFFAPARALYAAYGFEPCAPFGDYRPDPNSVLMSRRL